MTSPVLLSVAAANRGLGRMSFALAVVCTLTFFGMQQVQAQAFSVLHNFTGEADGDFPYARMTVTSSGVLYGTAWQGGTNNGGTVFKLSQVHSNWFFSTLYNFPVEGEPYGGVVIGPNGALYGATYGAAGWGTVYELRPPVTFCAAIVCQWSANQLYAFGPPNGEFPLSVDLVFDQAGNIYGTTKDGGEYLDGIVFKLSPSGGGYVESIIHGFGNGSDGQTPFAGVVRDASGNLYGTTQYGGTGTQCGTGNCGTVYQLAPSPGGWTESVLVNFDVANGYYPTSALTIDASGNLYGTASGGGQNGGGVAFKVSPSAGGWVYTPLYSFSSCQPFSGLAMDAGNFFGVCSTGGAHGYGWVYELTNCSQSCIVNDLHDFSGSDGRLPFAAPVLDSHGNLYGTTQLGGTGCIGNGCGVVWEIAGVESPRHN